MQEIPVYLFLGFLDAGKSKFIQETLEDKRFDSDQNTLVLICEEGEEVYVPARFAGDRYRLISLGREELTMQTLARLAAEASAARVVIEYNGMWELQMFFNAMPENWAVAQVMTFFDATTFLQYNQNMRQLVYDKVQYADMVVFNRFRGEYSKEQFHKIIRGMTRRPGIVYEYLGGKAEYDEIVDPLPYDINAEMIEIDDRDYAFFYRDLVEETQKYAGKVVRFKGLVAVDKSMKPGTIVIGRHIMTCCEADIAYSGLVCLYASGLPFRTHDWVIVTARIDIRYHKIYGQKGPVLTASAIDYAAPPEQELATFY